MAPLKKFSAGSVSCALWENEISTANGRKVPMLKATIDRRYKDKDGNWQSSGSFSRNEIPLAVFCLQKAFDKIVEMQNTASAGNNNNVEEISVLD